MDNLALLVDILSRIILIMPLVMLFYVLKIAMRNYSNKRAILYLERQEKKDIAYGALVFVFCIALHHILTSN